jgi:long-chain acyl-CoA synthetase
LYFRLRGEGTDNIPEGPCILAPNHQSFIDGLFVSAFLKNRTMRKTYFYAKEKHVRDRLVRAFAQRHNVIIMDINRDLKQSLQKLAEVLRKGRNIMIFPEGTRTQTGDLGNFKKAFAILSRELNVPVVPVSIKGAFDALPKGSKIPRPWKKIHIKFLEPVYPENHNYDSLTDLVFNKLASEQT